jgi:hypothetical protein
MLLLRHSHPLRARLSMARIHWRYPLCMSYFLTSHLLSTRQRSVVECLICSFPGRMPKMPVAAITRITSPWLTRTLCYSLIRSDKPFPDSQTGACGVPSKHQPHPSARRAYPVHLFLRQKILKLISLQTDRHARR